MPDKQVQQPTDIVERVMGPKMVAHDKDLASLREKVDRCYIKGDKEFTGDVADIVSETIQKDENRTRIKIYAREAAEELLREKDEKKTEGGWRWKSLWLPILFSIATLFIGLFLGPIIQNKVFQSGERTQTTPTPTPIP